MCASLRCGRGTPLFCWNTEGSCSLSPSLPAALTPPAAKPRAEGGRFRCRKPPCGRRTCLRLVIPGGGLACSLRPDSPRTALPASFQASPSILNLVVFFFPDFLSLSLFPLHRGVHQNLRRRSCSKRRILSRRTYGRNLFQATPGICSGKNSASRVNPHGRRFGDSGTRRAHRGLRSVSGVSTARGDEANFQVW